jgi:hypothetical protein
MGFNLHKNDSVGKKESGGLRFLKRYPPLFSVFIVGLLGQEENKGQTPSVFRLTAGKHLWSGIPETKPNAAQAKG